MEQWHVPASHVSNLDDAHGVNRTSAVVADATLAGLVATLRARSVASIIAREPHAASGALARRRTGHFPLLHLLGSPLVDLLQGLTVVLVRQPVFLLAF